MNRMLGVAIMALTLTLAARSGESAGSFVLKSSAIPASGALPEEFTGDGAGSTPPLEWSGAPSGTKSFALIMNHLDPEGKTKFYWTLYNIPADVTHLEKNSTGVGAVGLNTIKNRLGYAPPHSKGPGLKTYVLTMYALSDAPKLNVPAASVTGAILTDALKDITLAKAVLKITYDRTGKTDSAAQGKGQGQGRDGPPRDGPPRDESKRNGPPRDGPQGDGPRGAARNEPTGGPPGAAQDAPSEDARPKRQSTTAAIKDTAISQDGKAADGAPTPEQARAFLAFYGKVKLGFDADFLYVRAEGLPDHRMMVGITAWQQQVPIPQSYSGDNAWRIPLKPVEAKSPLSAKDHFFRGAIALAVNGVPIFNPIKNDGKTDTLIAGELDEFGGHCGRADDYHYHIAPLHLEKIVGAGKPIAYALDGYPIYGLNEPDGSPAKKLDAFNGHKDANGNYHYHATKNYPYLNGGFHGEVVERGGQVDPQPSAQPMRGAGTPLRGATITDFTSENMKKFALTYKVNGQPRTLRYSLEDDGSYKFIFTEADGSTKTEVYRHGQRNPGGGVGRASRGDGPPQPRGDGPPPRRDPEDNAGPRNGPGGTGGPEGAAPRSDAPSAPREDGPPPPRAEDNAPPRGGPGGGQGGQAGQGGPGGPGGQRKPWLQVHGAELDTNKDGIITLDEINDDMKRAFDIYDLNKDGVITADELKTKGETREGAAFAGFIFRHFDELGAPGSGKVTKDDVAAVVKYIFNAADLDKDGKLSTSEWQNAPNTPLQNRTAQSGDSTPPTPPTPPKDGEPPVGQGGGDKGKGKGKGKPDNKGLIKPQMSDTIKVNIYADNWFVMFINGKLRAVDSIEFTPHNVVSVDILPEYPMTIAIMAKDNADPKTGMEYGDHVGDGGFIIKFADGTVSNATWKAKNFFKGPLNHDTKNPVVVHTPIPDKWWTIDFDDSKWENATEFTEERVGPKEHYYKFDFTGAKFIWTDDLDLDNTVIFRTKVEKPGWKPRWNTKPDLDISEAPFK